MKKTFLLGVGAQKAGTTWLFQYLRGHPNCAMGNIKEHAVLRAALSDDRPPGRFSSKADALMSALQSAKGIRENVSFSPNVRSDLLALIDNLAGELDISYYLQTFERLLAENPQSLLTGDITPEYCMLSRAQLVQFREIIEKAGYDLKVVFLMRDPLDRIFSALRMTDRNRIASGEILSATAAERFDTQGVAEWVEARTRYERILAKLNVAFDTEQVHLGFYETFFTQGNLSKLLEFLNLPPHKADFSYMANASPEGGDIAPEKIEIVREFYDETYHACADWFGEEFISKIWQYYRRIGPGPNRDKAE